MPVDETETYNATVSKGYAISMLNVGVKILLIMV